MSSRYPETFGALKRSEWGSPDRINRSVKDELRSNLLSRLARGGPLFEGVVGYEDTVMGMNHAREYADSSHTVHVYSMKGDGPHTELHGHWVSSRLAKQSRH